MYKALWLMQTELFSATRSHGDRTGAINLGIVITDSEFPINYPGPRTAVSRGSKTIRDNNIGTENFPPCKKLFFSNQCRYQFPFILFVLK